MSSAYKFLFDKDDEVKECECLLGYFDDGDDRVLIYEGEDDILARDFKLHPDKEDYVVFKYCPFCGRIL